MSHEHQIGLLHTVGGSHVGVPLVGVNVEAEVHDFLCEVTLIQSYKNTNASDIEAVYHFALDEASAVCRFRAEYEDGVVVDAVVKEKAEARQEYQRAVRSGKQAQLLESVRPDIFTMTVGRMPSGSLLNIKVTYIALLKAEGSASRFLLPTHIAQRYSPSNKIAATIPSVPSTFQPCAGLNVRVKFNTQSNIKQLTSPSHPSAFAARLSGKTGEVVFPEDMIMNTDLIVLCEEETPHQPRACVEIAKDGSLAGLVTLFPEIEFRDVPREIVFVIDRSGSMGFGRDRAGKTQMESAREALMLFLRALPPSCSFNIIGFGSSHAALFPTSQPYNDHTLHDATQYAANMAANMGGTELLKPLRHALAGSSKNTPRQVFVLTDGQVSNESAVFECVRAGSAAGARTFCLGIGGGVSHHLVEGIARAGKGTAAFVTSGFAAPELQLKVLTQLKQALQPSLDNVSVTWNFPTPPAAPRVDVPAPSAPVKTLLGYRSPDVDKPAPPSLKAVVPRAFPTVAPPVFNRERFVSFALFPAGHTEVPTSVTVSASTPDGPLELELAISDEEVLSGHVAHRLAAREAIREFEACSDHRGAGSGAVSKAEALAFALTHSLASSLTSFVAVRSEPNDPSFCSMQLHHGVVLPRELELDEEVRERGLMQQQQWRSNVQVCMAMSRPVSRSRPSSAPDSTLSWRACPEPKPSAVSFSSAGVRSRKKETTTVEPERAATLCAQAGASACRGRGRSNGDAQAGPGVCGAALDASAPATSAMAGGSSALFRGGEGGSGGGVRGGGVRGGVRSRMTVCGSGDTRVRRSLEQEAESAAPAPQMLKSCPSGTHEAEQSAEAAGVFGLCLLQRANGSFELDTALASLLSVSVELLHTTVAAILHRVSPQTSLDASACGTFAALLAMRVLFSHHKRVFELQEGKAVAYLASRTADGQGFSAAQVEAGVGAVARVLVPSQCS